MSDQKSANPKTKVKALKCKSKRKITFVSNFKIVKKLLGFALLGSLTYQIYEVSCRWNSTVFSVKYERNPDRPLSMAIKFLLETS